MRFGLASLSLIKGHVKLGLIVCCIWYPHSRMRSIGNMVQLHLFFDCSHVFIFLPFIPVIFTDYFGSFRCLWTDTYRGQNGCLSYTGHSIYIKEELIATCLERVTLEDPTGVVNQELSCSRDKFLLLPFTLKSLTIINYKLFVVASKFIYICSCCHQSCLLYPRLALLISHKCVLLSNKLKLW